MHATLLLHSHMYVIYNRNNFTKVTHLLKRVYVETIYNVHPVFFHCIRDPLDLNIYLKCCEIKFTKNITV